MSDPGSEPRDSPSLHRRRLGVVLRRFRERSLISREVAGQELDCSESKISRIENGDVRVHQRDLYALLDLYSIDDTGVRADLREMAARGGKRGGWWTKYNNEVTGSFRRFMELETVATAIRRVSVTAVPGILQTQDYARQVIAATAPHYTDEVIARQLSLRAERQKRLTEPDPPDNWIVLDEAVLRRAVGGRRVMVGQLCRLLEAAEQPGVRMQLLPFDAGAHQAMPGSFAIMRFLPPDPDVVYSEGFTGEVTLDDPAELRSCSLVFDRLAGEALDPERTKRFIRRVIDEY
ncbi:MAG TPA: helix-turn-helix domain-containing protein [Candidatus Stackebrandtia excrementipullorum]|nr:helix-turn-helix domain-containing protein [Candidatus Stackebrandtia excrementipullorum]